MYLNIHQPLIDRCKLQDKEAQFRLYQLYYRSMFNTSLRIVNDRNDAEDIMQESFLTAFQKIDGYLGEVSFGIWLKRIVINRSLDYLRKRRVIFEEVRADLPLQEEEDPNEVEYQAEEIRKAIPLLSDNYRTILSLILLEGYDHEEVSEILDISHAASRTQYCRAKQSLRNLLEKRKMENSLMEQYG
ncbi:MAG: sigma-70 family RNA polymerase sigma factor [Marinilabiliales bacterium]|nr:sigma-70 family RNA polymerase sigma factor [Marinilabiliales bacterium]